MLTTSSLQSFFIDSFIGPRLWSDHAWVSASLQLKNGTPNTPMWRFNQNLLHLEPLRLNLETEIKNYFDMNLDCGVSLAIVWDAMKPVIRGRIIALTSAYKKQKQKYRDDLSPW